MKSKSISLYNRPFAANSFCLFISVYHGIFSQIGASSHAANFSVYLIYFYLLFDYDNAAVYFAMQMAVQGDSKVILNIRGVSSVESRVHSLYIIFYRLIDITSCIVYDDLRFSEGS